MPNQEDDNSYKATKNNENEAGHEANKKAAKIGAKVAADYFAPGVGGAAVDQLAKTKAGDAILNKGANALDKVPGLSKKMQKLDDKGALDTADKALSLAGGNSAGAAEGVLSDAAPEAAGDAAKGVEAANAGSAAKSSNAPQSSNSGENLSAGALPSPQKSSLKDSMNPFKGHNDGESSIQSGEISEEDSYGSSGDVIKLLMKNKKVGIIIIAFFFLILMVGAFVSILDEDGDGELNSDESAQTQACSSNTNLVSVAEKELGNNEANGTHAKYLSFLGFPPNTAWCAAFVSWVANKAGIDEKVIPHTAAVSSFLEYFKKNGTFKSLSTKYKPNPGDLIIWKANNSRGQARSHIGIVKEYDEAGDKLTTIEGNSSDAVRENIYKFSTLSGEGVVGFAAQECTEEESIDDGNVTEIKKGQTITLPSGLGTHATREFDLAYTNQEINYSRSQMKCCRKITNPYAFPESSTQRKVQNVWISEGGKHDSKGFCKLQGRYIVATTSTFGSIGDKVDFYMSNGVILHTVLGDAKAQSKAWYDLHPANKWGHSNGKNVLEFMGKSSIGDNPYYTLGLRGQNVVKAVNGGSVLK